MAGTSPAMTKSIAPPLTSAVFPPISPSPGPSGLSAFGGGGDRDDTIERRAGRAPAAAAVSLLAPRHARDGPDHGPLRRRHDRHAQRRRARRLRGPYRRAGTRALRLDYRRRAGRAG